MEVNIISITEIQINPLLLYQKRDLRDSLFCAEQYTCLLNNNSNELINKRQQGGILTSVRGEYSNLVKGSGFDPSNLGRWNWLDLHYNQKKIRIITAYRYVKSRSSKNIVYC